MSHNKRGPQRKPINWHQFDELTSIGCTLREIANVLDVGMDKLEDDCIIDNGIKLPEYYDKKRANCRQRLRMAQFRLAEEGNAAMAIWLGKQLLNQVDKPADQMILEFIQQMGLTPDKALEILSEQTKAIQATHKKSFKEFCIAAGYPAPFDKQLEMSDFFLKNDEPRLLLGSRGYGKTDYITILSVAYYVYLYPQTASVLIVTKSKDRNTSIINEIGLALIANGIVLEKQNAGNIRAMGLHGKDNSVSALTIKANSFRGRHPKKIIMDDPVTEDDTSEAVRLVVEKKYNELYKLTKDVMIIGQPAHKFDLYAKLRPLLLKIEMPFGSIPELDHDLEAQRAAGIDEKSIQASYFLKIVSEGATPFDNLQRIAAYPNTPSVAFIDPSHEGRDYTAISILTSYFDGIAVVGYAWQKAWNHCLDDLDPVLKKHNVGRMAFETNALGDMPIEILRKAFKNIGIVGRRSTNNKHSRIMAAGAYAHKIFLSDDSMKIYKDQVSQYEYGAKHDDCPDSLATCMEWLGLVRGKE